MQCSGWDDGRRIVRNGAIVLLLYDRSCNFKDYFEYEYGRAPSIPQLLVSESKAMRKIAVRKTDER
eukprot:4206579-Ditylum_brightwellii.AAC.1